jgi:hypothetical protein
MLPFLHTWQQAQHSTTYLYTVAVSSYLLLLFSISSLSCSAVGLSLRIPSFN